MHDHTHNPINKEWWLEALLPRWAWDDQAREDDEGYEAAVVVPDETSWGEVLRTGRKIEGTGIPLEEAR